MLSTMARGMAAGIAGTAVMTGAEKLEQVFTRRPDSYVPARTLAHLLGLPRPDEDRLGRNRLMHYGTGAMLGAVRGVMARANLRGPAASFMHTWIRLATDQTLENGTGVGAPPATWPRSELIVDVAHKAVYSFATGALADAIVVPKPTSSVGRPAQRLRLPGFA
ncbi:MAG: hypothetical protein AVDCRST_MAG38-1698 [uncultured Solirubrobacteraceae bacterium]|uniref:Uncharacterized protein n=1 Tax=uncultured Solirubrobacteraceae bacterium TaxID=1162706 RepID=A0A6J4RRZ2_9ACTN|nr:MAG: hypothetical protein AVDCRST_MAG38-1698 [uncultured Solirubrobacteraceae bacterium]